MLYLWAFIVSAISFIAASAQAADPGDAGPQPYFVMQIRDCSLPVCEEQSVYLTADGRQMFLRGTGESVPLARLEGGTRQWHRARPDAFAEVWRLTRSLAEALPDTARCEPVKAPRLIVAGTLVLGRETVKFRFSDACAGRVSDSRSHQLIRELREALTLGVQPLLKG